LTLQCACRRYWLEAKESTKVTYRSCLQAWIRFIEWRRSLGHPDDFCVYPDTKARSSPQRWSPVFTLQVTTSEIAPLLLQVAQFLRWRLQELTASKSKDPAGTVKNHLNALRRSAVTGYTTPDLCQVLREPHADGFLLPTGCTRCSAASQPGTSLMVAKRCCACCRTRARRPPSVPVRGQAHDCNRDTCNMLSTCV
jgi:hypothetical protein